MAIISTKESVYCKTKTLQVKDLMEFFQALIDIDRWSPDMQFSVKFYDGHIWLEYRL